MPGVRVESLDALRSVRIALAKFADSVSSVLASADADLQRTLMWLETEQLAYWKAQQRIRAELVLRAREALRSKTQFKGLNGRVPTALEEREALQMTLQRLEEAEQKIVAVKKWAPRLKNEIMVCHGGVQRLATSVQSDLPLAMEQLAAMIGSLEAYVALENPAAPEAAGRELPAQGDASPPETT